jgi:hypothetical protein
VLQLTHVRRSKDYMKRRTIPRLLSVISCVGLVALLAALLPSVAPANAAPAAPQVTVYLKNYHEEYNLATSEFLAAQFDNLDSPAYGLVSYTVVTNTLTAAALAGSVALVIDESADMSLTAGEAAVIHSFVSQGGRVGLFAFPRYYWDQEAPNPAAYQGIADLWGITAIGSPAAAEVASGDSSAVVAEPEDGTLSFSVPYSLTGQTASTFDQLPFSPITASGSAPVLVSPALNQAPVAVANQHGVFVTNSIGDAVQGGDANPTYSQFVADAIVWLASGGPLLPIHYYLPMMWK